MASITLKSAKIKLKTVTTFFLFSFFDFVGDVCFPLQLFRNGSSKLAIFKNAFMIYELLVYYPWAVARFLESRMRVEASLPSSSLTY